MERNLFRPQTVIHASHVLSHKYPSEKGDWVADFIFSHWDGDLDDDENCLNFEEFLGYIPGFSEGAKA